MSTEMVTLKNGSEELKTLVTSVLFSIDMVFKAMPIALLDLAMKAKDSNHEFFGKTGEILKAAGLVQSDGSLHQSVKNVVLSCVEGEGADMTFGSPWPARPRNTPKTGLDLTM